ncbi:hypothetical protein BDP27DRAFT_1318192 [Rhodocollybia butyracea]|uniref:Uncharacterized protein n=1 Tax=Rhodocollybia butyracea TaxID=206335 RepID=A0A9P5Q2F0_9AGAR|nr:hypothetical protein BDP27DRAFT_1318192 [Rhodocollybia butyracea]
MSSYSDKSQVIVSAVHTLDESPPPSLREILSAYRSNGDGDRDMLLALLNAKTAEDRRLAEQAALHRSIIDSFTYDQSTSSNLPPLLPTLSSGFRYPNGESYTHKRYSSRSPPHHNYSPYAKPSSRRSTTPPMQTPPSPYSSASNSDPTFSPKTRERGNMPIASMLSNEDRRISPELEDQDELIRGRR